MSSQIFDCRFYSLIDLDLLNARIALDVKNAIGNEQIVIKFLRRRRRSGSRRLRDKVAGFSLIAGRQLDCLVNSVRKTPSDF